jgi:alginate O-acetyltransferase complex protein AlgI
MLFNSDLFLLGFLPASILIYWFADKNPRWRTWVLILLSLIFYGYWDVRFVPLLASSILLNWCAAGAYAATRRSAILTATIGLDLAILALFKYFNFFAENLHMLLGVPLIRVQWALPLGISFFTFHHIMYLVDLRRGRAPIYSLDKYALYICFFPQAIAGPIARWSEVIDQFGKRVFEPGWQRRCALGVTFIVIGLVQKTMLGDPLGRILDPIYQRALTGPVIEGQGWLAMAFAFQVFFDFAGYSDIAIGLGLIFGITLPRNFDGPFRTTSMIDFWQRWHITLARFLRDYVFTPLSRIPVGGSRHRMTRALFAILLTMALCGLWHGAGWTFILWGTLQGVAIVFAAVWPRYTRSPPAFVGWAATVGFFLLTIVLFRAHSLDAAWHVYGGMASLPTGTYGFRTIALAAFCAIVLPPSHVIATRLTERPNGYVPVALAAVTLMVLLQISRFNNYEFIYFQF